MDLAGNAPGGKFKVVMNEQSELDAVKVFGENKPDHRILNAALVMMAENQEKQVILVSKDVNLRLKAKSLNISAEDFETGKIKDVEGLYSGKTLVEGLDKTVIDVIYQAGWCMPEDIGIKNPIPNHYFILKNGKSSVLAFYNPFSKRIEKIEKYECYKINPSNAEQVFALHAILNPNVKLVTLQGIAGTGKTLLALAGALEQKRNFKQIYQIDTPYLDAQSNGLSTLIDKVKKHDIYAHIRLEKGERSELANLANELL